MTGQPEPVSATDPARRWFVAWMLLSACLIWLAHPLAPVAAGLLFIPTLAWIGHSFGLKVLGVSLLSALILSLALSIPGLALPIWILGFLLVWYLHELIATDPTWLAYVLLMLLFLGILWPAIGSARAKLAALELLREPGQAQVERALAAIGPGARLEAREILELTDVTTNVGARSFLLQVVVRSSPGDGALDLLRPERSTGFGLRLDDEGRAVFTVETAERPYQIETDATVADGDLHLLLLAVDREARALRLYDGGREPIVAAGPRRVELDGRVQQHHPMRLIEARIGTVRAVE